MKSLTKSELARLMNISAGTLQKLLNRQWFDGLIKLGYNKNSRLLSPKICKWIFEEWGLEIDSK